MSDGPVIIYDKSTIQALNPAEVFCLDCHYRINIVPVFFVEVLADLHKQAPKGRTPEAVVGSIAGKISGFSAMPNMYHALLCLGDLLGYPVEMRGIPVIGGGKPIQGVDGKTTMFFDEPPEIAAMRRWRKGDFHGVERDFAKAWRQGLENQNLDGIAAAMRPDGKSPLSNLDAVRAAADVISAGRGKRYKSVKLALTVLSIPPDYHSQIIARWKACGGPPMRDFAPYADYVFRVDLFFYLGMASKLIASTRPSHRVDLAYLYYLPFCSVFSSFDKFHAAIVPQFLADWQMFIPGAELKSELSALAHYYAALPAETRAKGAMTYAAYPPTDGEFLTSRLYDKYDPGWRKRAENPVEITPELNKRLMEDLGPMINAIEQSQTSES